MWHSSFFYSILLHAVIVLALFISIPNWRRADEKAQSVPILIDLKNIKIADKTHLPNKGEKVESKKTVRTTSSALAPKPTEEVVPIQKETSEPKSKVILDKKTEKKPDKKITPKVKPVPKVPQKTVTQKPVKPVSKPAPKAQEDDMEQLLASVEKMEKNLGKATSADTKSNKAEGQENGVKGGLPSDKGVGLSVSQVDFISATVRKYWNRDLGIEGAENMKIKLRISLDAAGHVRNVEFSDLARYHSDAGYRSMADSARRAVYTSDKIESPFVVVPEELRREEIVFMFIP